MRCEKHILSAFCTHTPALTHTCAHTRTHVRFGFTVGVGNLSFPWLTTLLIETYGWRGKQSKMLHNAPDIKG